MSEFMPKPDWRGDEPFPWENWNAPVIECVIDGPGKCWGVPRVIFYSAGDEPPIECKVNVTYKNGAEPLE